MFERTKQRKRNVNQNIPLKFKYIFKENESSKTEEDKLKCYARYKRSTDRKIIFLKFCSLEYYYINICKKTKNTLMRGYNKC